jgi:hypothetical protein
MNKGLVNRSVRRPGALKLVCAVILFSIGLSAHAVDVNGRIRGVVMDPQGAVIPNAQVTAVNEQTGVKYTTKSQGDGAYLFPQLPIGTYDVLANASGFKAFTATGITLTIDQEYVEQIKLSVGDTTERVEVQADSVQVNTTDMQFDNIVDARQMEELPLIGRDFTQLELTLPGTQLPDNRFGTFSVSGAQSQQSEYLINGADTNDIALNTIVFTPNLDAIGQFNMLSGPLNAEYDRNSGGIVSAAIKTGTNQFHGDAYDFYRDTFLNTNNYVEKQGDIPVSPYHQNIFGGTLGGPIWRDKVFFFGAYEGIRESVPETGSANTLQHVFTPAQLSGDFSTDLTPNNQAGITGFSNNPVPSTISIPGCSTGEPWSQCLTTGVIPATTFNSVATGLVKKYVPGPNSPGAGYSFNSTQSTSQDQYIGRIDFNLNPKNQFTALGLYQKLNLVETLPFTGATLPGFGDGQVEHIQQWTADYVRQISATAVNDLSAHYTRFNFVSGIPQKVVLPSTAGFAITPQDPANATIPTLDINGYFTLGGASSGPQPRIDQVIQFDDSFSKVFGNHSFKFGYDGRRFNVTNSFDASNSGSYTFSSGATFSTGDAGLDFLLGIPATYTQTANSIIQADAFLNYFFAQDTWKATNTLTIDYGLGYSIDTPMHNDQYGGEGVSCFIVGEQSTVFPNAPKNMVFPGDPGCSNSGQAVTHYNEFGPRLGFAWAPDLGAISGSPGNFSIRGGFGIYYDRTEEESALQTLGTPPFGLSSSGAGDIGGSTQLANPFADINGGAGANGGTGTKNGAASERNPFPFTQPVKGQPVPFPKIISNISSFAPSFRAPYAENFQISVERELPSKIVARISYVGSLAHRNQIAYEGNYETAAGHAACLANPACIASRNTQAVNFPGNKVGGSPVIVEEGLVGSEGSSSYNSAQVSITKATTHGLQFQLSYTFAHAMDNGSSFENPGFASGAGEPAARGYNQYDQSLNYGDSTYDVRHHLVFAPVYISPLRPGSAFSPFNLAFSGWEISGIFTLAGGQPYDISYNGYGTSRSLYCDIATPSFYACPDVPNQIAPLVRMNPKTSTLAYFSPASFAPEAIGSFGNVHRDPYHGPGYDNTNLILAKNFNVSADGVRRIQLRMESDNVFNHTNFNNPDGSFVDGTFGSITSAQPSRLTQLAGKFYF